MVNENIRMPTRPSDQDILKEYLKKIGREDLI
jgi:hypothetical protein